VTIVLAPKAAAEISPNIIPSIARFCHIYEENEIGEKVEKEGGEGFYKIISDS
jgi:hypothetical protein